MKLVFLTFITVFILLVLNFIIEFTIYYIQLNSGNVYNDWIVLLKT
jgi:hypothetical protein